MGDTTREKAAARTLLLTLRFIGTRYCGSQVQQNGVSITERVQDAIEAVFGERLPVKGCSRTDSGVHALGYCMSFQTERTIACDAVVRALNGNLPHDIAVTDCTETTAGFHARYSAKGKEYLYKIDNGRTRDPFLHQLAYYYKYPLDEVQLDTLCAAFTGTHDYASFCSAHAGVTDTVRTVYGFHARREGDTILLTVQGDGFLYNMVRIMVGTLLRAVENEWSGEDIRRVILARDRAQAGITVPAQGLYLNRVFYDSGMDIQYN